jgi:hypothetical protein
MYGGDFLHGTNNKVVSIIYYETALT